MAILSRFLWQPFYANMNALWMQNNYIYLKGWVYGYEIMLTSQLINFNKLCGIIHTRLLPMEFSNHSYDIMSSWGHRLKEDVFVQIAHSIISLMKANFYRAFVLLKLMKQWTTRIFPKLLLLVNHNLLIAKFVSAYVQLIPRCNVLLFH